MHHRGLKVTRGPTLILLVMVLAIVAIVVAIPLSPTWTAVMGTFLALVIGVCATALGQVIRHGIVSMTLLKNTLAMVTGMYHRLDTTLHPDDGDIRRLLRPTITSRRGMTPFYLTY